jgi:tRNA (guanine37-N1)-methyltransferase
MFAGVAPFPLIIAKHSKPSVIYAIDINPDAAELASRNVKLNKVGNIVIICGDSSAAIKDLPSAARIIMNLPHVAHSFLPDALSNLKKGGTIHIHKIMERSSSSETISELIDGMRKKGFAIKVTRVAELKTYSPTASVYVMDILKE